MYNDIFKKLATLIVFHYGNLKNCWMKLLSVLPPSNNNLAPSLNYFGTKTRTAVDERCLKQERIIFTHRKAVNIFIVYEINLWNRE